MKSRIYSEPFVEPLQSGPLKDHDTYVDNLLEVNSVLESVAYAVNIKINEGSLEHVVILLFHRMYNVHLDHLGRGAAQHDLYAIVRSTV